MAKPGARVVLRGLQTQPDLNGRCGTVTGAEAGSRWRVALSRRREVAVREENLLVVQSMMKLGYDVELHGLRMRPELNGRKGTVVELLPGEEARCGVRLEGEDGAEAAQHVQVRAANLRLQQRAMALYEFLLEAMPGRAAFLRGCGHAEYLRERLPLFLRWHQWCGWEEPAAKARHEPLAQELGLPAQTVAWLEARDRVAAESRGLRTRLRAMGERGETAVNLFVATLETTQQEPAPALASATQDPEEREVLMRILKSAYSKVVRTQFVALVLHDPATRAAYLRGSPCEAELRAVLLRLSNEPAESTRQVNDLGIPQPQFLRLVAARRWLKSMPQEEFVVFAMENEMRVKPEEERVALERAGARIFGRFRIGDPCAACGREGVPLRRCGRCHGAGYCSSECQAAAWPAHKRCCAQR